MRLGAFGAELEFGQLPVEVVDRAKLHLLDTLGAGIAGMRSPEAGICLATLRATAEGSCPLWGTPHAAAPATAAIINGVAAHALELDDTDGCDHSGAVVVPAVLAALSAAPEGATGGHVLTAVVIGYDVARRVLDASGGYDAYNAQGWHSTGVCGTFGAAAAAAKVLGLDAVASASALGLAGSFTGGLWAFLTDGSMSKRLHAGRAAEGGLTAAMLAKGGFTGPREIFEAEWGGYFSTYVGKGAEPGALTRDLGRQWRIEQSSIKPYASCRGTHAAVDAIMALLREQRIPVSNVESVHVRLSPFLHRMCGETAPTSLLAAQMSMPFALAAAAVRGRIGLEEISEVGRTDGAVVDFMNRVVLDVDDTQSGSAHPVIEVRTKNGTSHTVRAGEPLGSPSNPLAAETIVAKFLDLADGTLTGPQARRIVDIVLDLDRIDDATALVRSLVGESTPRPFR
jgi:2-methylcitrate dehydratase PrpD